MTEGHTTKQLRRQGKEDTIGVKMMKGYFLPRGDGTSSSRGKQR